MRIKFSRVLPFLLVSSVLSGCATTSSTGDAPLNQGNWPLCSAIGALAGGGLGAIESSTWAAGGAVAGALLGTIICYAQVGERDVAAVGELGAEQIVEADRLQIILIAERALGLVPHGLCRNTPPA